MLSLKTSSSNYVRIAASRSTFSHFLHKNASKHDAFFKITKSLFKPVAALLGIFCTGSETCSYQNPRLREKDPFWWLYVWVCNESNIDLVFHTLQKVSCLAKQVCIIGQFLILLRTSYLDFRNSKHLAKISAECDIYEFLERAERFAFLPPRWLGNFSPEILPQISLLIFSSFDRTSKSCSCNNVKATPQKFGVVSQHSASCRTCSN